MTALFKHKSLELDSRLLFMLFYAIHEINLGDRKLIIKWIKVYN